MSDSHAGALSSACLKWRAATNDLLVSSDQQLKDIQLSMRENREIEANHHAGTGPCLSRLPDKGPVPQGVEYTEYPPSEWTRAIEGIESDLNRFNVCVHSKILDLLSDSYFVVSWTKSRVGRRAAVRLHSRGLEGQTGWSQHFVDC